MTLAALQHLAQAAHALAGDRTFLVLGSASLLASFPELGDGSSPLAFTYDADLCPEPFDELTGLMLERKAVAFPFLDNPNHTLKSRPMPRSTRRLHRYRYRRQRHG